MLSAGKQLKLKNEVLGEAYDLSFAFVDSLTSHRLNKLYRHKDKPANVLSFPLGPNSGEILIDRELVTDPLEQLKMFIHGLLHLAGLHHGSIMDKQEKRWFAFIANQHVQNHRRRPRHRERLH